MSNKELKNILTEKGIKQSWVAEKLKVSAALVNQWVKDEKPISDKYKIELTALFN